MDTINIALIGAGSMANSVHYPSLAECPDVQMVGLCDIIPERLEKTAARFRIPRMFTNYREMIEKTVPDAVYVLMPSYHHFDILVHCLSLGLHIFIEKPPAVTTHQIRNLAILAEKHNCKTMVGFNRRFIPLMVEARKRVEEKGPIIQCMATFYKNQPAALYYNGAIDVLTCDAIHAVDVLRWMGGEVTQLASDINSFHSDRENSFNALLRFEGGASGILMTNWAVGNRVHIFEMHALGISAFINPDPEGKAVILETDQQTEISTVEAAGTTARHHTYGFFGETRHFIDCIKTDRQPDTCFADAVKTMELVDRIYVNRLR